MADPSFLLRAGLDSGASAEGLGWLDEQCAAQRAGAPERQFFMAISAARRHVGRGPLTIGKEEAETARPGWQPGGWTCDQAARTLLALSLPHDDPAAYVAVLDKCFENADLGELVALYQALPVLSHPDAHVARCAEGVRTNITAVFCAVTHRNPYPKEHLAEDAWNQMVLKALFSGVALDPIDGLDERAGPALAAMLCDYAHERWAAGRSVSPELWRCVGPYADAALEDLERALTDDDERSRWAASLALQAGDPPSARAAELLERHPVTLPADLDWSDLA